MRRKEEQMAQASGDEMSSVQPPENVFRNGIDDIAFDGKT